MADISVERKNGGGSSGLTWIWAIAAVASVLGLMVWLLSTQGTTTTVVTEGATTDSLAAGAPAPAGGTAETADLPAIGAAPDSYMGRELQVAGVEVAAVLG